MATHIWRFVVANPADDNVSPEAETGNTDGEESPFAGLSQEEAIARLEEAEKLRKRYESSSAEARRLHEENLALKAKQEVFDTLGNTGASTAPTRPDWQASIKEKGYADADDIAAAVAEAEERAEARTLGKLAPLFEEAQAHEKLSGEIDGFSDVWPKAAAWMKDNPSVAADYQSLVSKGASAEAKKMLIYAYRMEHPGRGRRRPAPPGGHGEEETVNKQDAGIPEHSQQGTGNPSNYFKARQDLIERIRAGDREGAMSMVVSDDKIIDMLRVSNPGWLRSVGIE